MKKVNTYRWFLSLEPGLMPRRRSTFHMDEATAKEYDPTAEPDLGSLIVRDVLDSDEARGVSNTPMGGAHRKPS